MKSAPLGVYPHSRGGTSWTDTERVVSLGLSPLAWGNHHQGTTSPIQHGSIPTRVGEPSWKLTIARRAAGLSPLAWGNQ